jgi:hypothetical protein
MSSEQAIQPWQANTAKNWCQFYPSLCGITADELAFVLILTCSCQQKRNVFSARVAS